MATTFSLWLPSALQVTHIGLNNITGLLSERFGCAFKRRHPLTTRRPEDSLSGKFHVFPLFSRSRSHLQEQIAPIFDEPSDQYPECRQVIVIVTAAAHAVAGELPARIST